MVVGVLRFVLQIPASGSLKAKRQVLRKVLDRIRARFNVSAAEVADNDLWQKATIGIAAVGNDRAFLNEVLSKVLRSVDEGGADCQIVSHELELTTISDMYGVRGSLAPERTLAEAEADTMPSIAAPDLDLEATTADDSDTAADRLLNSPPARRRR